MGDAVMRADAITVLVDMPDGSQYKIVVEGPHMINVRFQDSEYDIQAELSAAVPFLLQLQPLNTAKLEVQADFKHDTKMLISHTDHSGSPIPLKEG